MVSNTSYYTTYSSNIPLRQGKVPVTADCLFAAERYTILADALKDCSRRCKEGYLHQNIYWNDAILIGRVVNGQCQSPADLSAESIEQVQDALAAFQAYQFGFPADQYDRLFFFAGTGTHPPTWIFTEFKENCLDQCSYDILSAINVFQNLPDQEDKSLYISLGRNVSGQCSLVHIPLITRDRTGALRFCEPAGHSDIQSMIVPILKECLSHIFPNSEMRVGKWGIILAGPGECYGSYGQLTNDTNSAVVEFYDHSQDPARFPRGQFVTRYSIDTLLNRDRWSPEDYSHGLCLDPAIPAWRLSGPEITAVINWLQVKDESFRHTKKPTLSEQMNDAQVRRAYGQKNERRKEHERDCC